MDFHPGWHLVQMKMMEAADNRAPPTSSQWWRLDKQAEDGLKRAKARAGLGLQEASAGLKARAGQGLQEANAGLKARAGQGLQEASAGLKARAGQGLQEAGTGLKQATQASVMICPLDSPPDAGWVCRS